MDETARTGRRRIETVLREQPHSLTELATAVERPTDVIIEDVAHVARSLENGEATLLVSPPTCRACGFDDFDNPAKAPSRCPECRGENLTDPVFTIE